jgi:DNA repair protein RecO (recombination protein O)
MNTIIKTEGIALRVEPFSRTSSVSRWLTPDHGRVTLIAKGAQRPRSALLGQFDLFYTCELVFHTKPVGAVNVLRECTPLQPRLGLRQDWQATACASYFCHLVEHASLPGGDTHRICGLLGSTLDYLESAGAPPLLPVWFELQLVRLLGLAPQLGRCTACGAPFPAGGAPPRMAFAPGRGGVVCGRCAAGMPDPALPLPPDAWALLRAWQIACTPRQAMRLACTPEQKALVTRVLGRFLEYHLETSDVPRECALGLLSELRR